MPSMDESLNMSSMSEATKKKKGLGKKLKNVLRMSTNSKSGKKSAPSDNVTSHKDCNFCNTQFADCTDEEIVRLKYKMTQFKNDIKSRKEEEFFRMVLLSYQMVNRKNKRMTALDPVALYKEVEEKNIPFYRYQDWIEHKGK